MAEQLREGTVPEREVGKEWPPVEIVVTKEMVQYFLIGINDRHSWYRESSPIGPAVAPPSFAGMLGIRASAKRMWGDFSGAIFTNPHRLAYMTEMEFHDPIIIGEKVTIRSKSLGVTENRGREFARTETTIYGEDGRLCTRSVGTSLLQYRKTNEDA